MEGDAQIRVAKVFSTAVAKIIRYSLNDKFRSECFDAFGVTNTDDFQKECEEETLKNIRPKSTPVEGDTSSYSTLPENYNESRSRPLTDTTHTNRDYQPEIEVIELDSSDGDEECTPADDQLTCFSQSAQIAATSQTMSQNSSCLSKSSSSSQQSTSLSKLSQQSAISKSSQQSAISKSSQQSSTISSSQQSTPPLWSQLFD